MLGKIIVQEGQDLGVKGEILILDLETRRRWGQAYRIEGWELIMETHTGEKWEQNYRIEGWGLVLKNFTRRNGGKPTI